MRVCVRACVHTRTNTHTHQLSARIGRAPPNDLERELFALPVRQGG